MNDEFAIARIREFRKAERGDFQNRIQSLLVA